MSRDRWLKGKPVATTLPHVSRRKERLTVVVDADLVEAANRAVATGRALSLSWWVNLALAEQEARDRRLTALGEAVAASEAAHRKRPPKRAPRRTRTRGSRLRAV